MSLFSDLRIFSQVLPQALEGNFGMAHGEYLDARLHWGRVIAQHVKAGAEGDNLDRHRLTTLAVVLRDVACIVEHQFIIAGSLEFTCRISRCDFLAISVFVAWASIGSDRPVR